MVRNLSCPAVSHICNLIVFVSKSTERILKSTPMVEIYESVYLSSTNLDNKHDLPVPIYHICHTNLVLVLTIYPNHEQKYNLCNIPESPINNSLYR